MSYLYTAYGLTIKSEIELPELKPHGILTINPVDADVTIRSGMVEENLPSAHSKRKHVQVGDREVLLTFKHVGRFLVTNGTDILFSSFAQAQPSQIRLHLLGSCLGAIFQQRSKLTFHGGAVNIKNQITLFLGKRGTGKSTLTATFFNRGYLVFSDDVCVMDDPYVGNNLYPGAPFIKLCTSSLKKLGSDSVGLQKVITSREKYLLPLPTGSENAPVKVDRIYILRWGNQIRITHVSKKEALPLLAGNTYRPWMSKKNLGEAKILDMCTQLIQRIPVYTLTRPFDITRIEEAIPHIESHGNDSQRTMKSVVLH